MRMQKLLGWSCFFIGLIPALLYTVRFFRLSAFRTVFYMPWLMGMLFVVFSSVALWRCYKKEPLGDGRYHLHPFEILYLALTLVLVGAYSEHGFHAGVMYTTPFVFFVAIGLTVASRKSLRWRNLYALGFAVRALGAVFMSYFGLVIVDGMLKSQISVDKPEHVFLFSLPFLLGGMLCSWMAERLGREQRDEKLAA